MSNTLTPVDRLRIERVVWTVDLLVQDLPRRSRRAVRRELRDNLRAAAAEAGAAQAVRGLGSLRRLAADYLDAEYGEGGRRPRWLNGLAWAVVVEVLVLGIMFAGWSAFIDGIVAANPHAAGTYNWGGLGVWGLGETVTMAHGHVQSAVLTFSAAILLWYAAAFVLGARLWRLLPPWHRR
jgi:hypothetical protein